MRPAEGAGAAPRESLQRRFIGATVAVYLATAAGAALALRPVLDGVIEGLGVKFASQRVLLEKARLEGLVEREVALARALASSPAIVAWSKAEEDPEARRRGLAELSAFRGLFRDKTTFLVMEPSRHFYFQDDKTKEPELSYTVDPAKPADSWYRATLDGAGPYRLNFDRDVVLDTAKIWINVVIRDGDRKIGVGGTGLDISDFTRELVREGGDEVSVVVIDEGGALQVHRDHRLLERNAKADAEGKPKATIFELLSDEGDRARLRHELQGLKARGGGVATLTLPVEGRRRLAAVAWIGELRWFDVVLVDTSAVVGREQFAPLFGVGVAFALALTVWVGMLVNRWVLARLAKLTGSTLEIAGGHYGTEIAVDRDDEIGALTRAFNQMSGVVKEHTQGLEQKVAERTEALQVSNDQLAQANKKLRDSIEYAKLIQDSILPRDTAPGRLDMAVLWSPRDVVSGDFYVLHGLPEGRLLLGVFDCTGHGVPGAFMTMTANAALSSELEAAPAASPATLLSGLHRRVRAALRQESKGQIDSGLDAALCVVEPGGKLAFSGAKISLFVAHEGEVSEVKPDRHGVGYARLSEGKPYTDREVEVKAGATFYLTTDGLLDEPRQGGPPFGKTRFIELLGRVASLPVAQQRDEIKAAVEAYRGELPQRDDVTVVVFRLSLHAHRGPGSQTPPWGWIASFSP